MSALSPALDPAEPRRKVLVATPRGWCAGVERSVDIVERTLQR